MQIVLINSSGRTHFYLLVFGFFAGGVPFPLPLPLPFVTPEAEAVCTEAAGVLWITGQGAVLAEAAPGNDSGA